MITRQHMHTLGPTGQSSQNPGKGPPPTVRTQSNPCLSHHPIQHSQPLSLMISICGEYASPVVKADVHFPHPSEAGQGLTDDS